jgi:TPR repeat protein
VQLGVALVHGSPGLGLAADPLQAAAWLRAVPLPRPAVASYALALCLEQLSVPPPATGMAATALAAKQSEVTALYTDAARAGHAGAQYNLALRLLQGKGAARSPAAARSWFARAADQGTYAGSLFFFLLFVWSFRN